MPDPIAQAAANLAKNNDANKVAGSAAAASPLSTAGGLSLPTLTGNPATDIYNTIESLGEKLLADLQAAAAVANGSGSAPVDPIAAPAYAALISLVQMVIAVPATGTQGIITIAEKIRIIGMTVESSAFKLAVSPLVLDVVQQVQNLTDGIIKFLTGAAMTGVIALPKIP